MTRASPCPFCGQLDIHRIELPENAEINSDGDPLAIPAADYVHCNTCGASGPQHDPGDLAGWDAWNNRADIARRGEGTYDA